MRMRRIKVWMIWKALKLFQSRMYLWRRKKCALVALKDISVECEPAFHPFLAQFYDKVTNLLDYHNYDIRASAIEAAGYFLIAYHKAGTAEAEVKFTEGWSVFLDQMVTVVKEEDKHQVVIAALDILSDIEEEAEQDDNMQ